MFCFQALNPLKETRAILICKRKTQLVEHITINYSELKTVHKNFFFLTGGDKNDLEISNILDISPSLHMHNTRPTYGNKNIDILVSDMVHHYSEPIIIQNVLTDIPDGQPRGRKTVGPPYNIQYTKAGKGKPICQRTGA